VALVDQVLDALAGTEGEMVLFPKSKHVGNGLPTLFPFFLGRRRRHTARGFKSSFNDFLRRTADTASERRFEELLPVGRELDRHAYQYNRGETAASRRRFKMRWDLGLSNA
jgi:hypothetical protein